MNETKKEVPGIELAAYVGIHWADREQAICVRTAAGESAFAWNRAGGVGVRAERHLEDRPLPDQSPIAGSLPRITLAEPQQERSNRRGAVERCSVQALRSNAAVDGRRPRKAAIAVLARESRDAGG